MESIKKEGYLFCLALVGMIGCIVLIAMGHNSLITTTFIGLNGAGLVGGVAKVVKSKISEVKVDGKEKEIPKE